MIAIAKISLFNLPGKNEYYKVTISTISHTLSLIPSSKYVQASIIKKPKECELEDECD